MLFHIQRGIKVTSQLTLKLEESPRCSTDSKIINHKSFLKWKREKDGVMRRSMTNVAVFEDGGRHQEPKPKAASRG